MTSGQEESNGLIYVGVPRERVYITSFVDNFHAILSSLQNDGLACGYFQAESHRVDRNRDRIVEEFMSHSQKPEWLLMLDSDMEHPIDCGQRLARWGKMVVGGLYFHRNQHKDPVAFKRAKKEEDKYGRLVRMWEPIRNQVHDWLIQNNVPLRDGAFSVDGNGFGLLEVDAVGTGCMLIHRSVLERMEPPWFEYRDGSQSEDLEFCDRVISDLNIPVHVDMTTVSGHYSQVPLGQAQFRAIHEGRGYSLSSYTPNQAVDWLSEYLNITLDVASEMLKNYSPTVMAGAWYLSEDEWPDVAIDYDWWYASEGIGKTYLLDLLHWNASPVFNRIRHNLIPWRNKTVLEFGSGIGTLAIQMAIQNNNVTGIEINSVLREFSQFRWDRWTRPKLASLAGNIYLLDSIESCSIGEGGSYDLVMAIDAFEHLEAEKLLFTLKKISKLMKTGGRLFFHNNFGQQDIYPMHFDHTKAWPSMLKDGGFFQLGDLWAVKIV